MPIDTRRHNPLFSAQIFEMHAGWILVAGLGPVGSRVVYHLAKLGLRRVSMVDRGVVSELDVQRGMYRSPGGLRAGMLVGLVAEWVAESFEGSTEVTSSLVDGVSHLFLCEGTPQEKVDFVETYLDSASVLVIDIGFDSNEGVIMTFETDDKEAFLRWKHSCLQRSSTAAATCSAAGAAVFAAIAVWQLMYWARRRLGVPHQLQYEIRHRLDALGLVEPTVPEVPPRQLRQLDVVGVGATGSAVTHLLLQWGRSGLLQRLGIGSLKLWDPDVVEAHNVANQLYGLGDVGRYKTEGMVALARKVAPNLTVVARREELARLPFRRPLLGSVLFLLVDTMAGRKQIATRAIFPGHATELVIETRLGPEFGYLFSFDGTKRGPHQEWLRSLVPDREIRDTTGCGGTIMAGPTASLVAGLAVGEMLRSLQAERQGGGDPNQKLPVRQLTVDIAPALITLD